MEKIKEIDGLRAIAILLVVAWHYLGASDGPQSPPWRLSSSAASALISSSCSPVT
jgi:peptidoglycan/LPS O-acetylase OafA/YrhL